MVRFIPRSMALSCQCLHTLQCFVSQLMQVPQVGILMTGGDSGGRGAQHCAGVGAHGTVPCSSSSSPLPLGGAVERPPPH